MISKCRAICIRTVAYSESSVILHCYTDQHGIQAYMINGVRSRKGSIRPSQLLPLTLLELEAYHQQNKNLQRIKELRCQPLIKDLHFNMVKSAIGMFMAEVINKTVKEEAHGDAALFSFLFSAIQILDLEEHKTANFPLFFIVQLSRYIGFYPKGQYTAQHNSFDIQEGSFAAWDPRNPYQVKPELSEKLSQLLHGSFENYHETAFTYAQRSELLEHMLDYYRQHLEGFHEIKSYKVLAEVLG